MNALSNFKHYTTYKGVIDVGTDILSTQRSWHRTRTAKHAQAHYQVESTNTYPICGYSYSNTFDVRKSIRTVIRKLSKRAHQVPVAFMI